MTATKPFYLSVPGDHFLLFRSCSQAITTEPWRPGDLLIWRRALCLNALVTPAFCSFCVHNHIRRRQPRQMRKVFFQYRGLPGRANSGGRSAPFLKPRASSSLSAPIRAGCKGDGALGVTSKCPLDRYGEREREGESAVVPTFLAQQNNCCSPFSTNPATVPKSAASSAPVLKKNPNNQSPKRRLLSQGKNVINKNITQGWDTCSLTSNWPGCPWLAYYIRPQKEKGKGGRRGESGKEQTEGG